MNLKERILKILETNYGNPIGGKTTHWYINDQVTQDILKAIDEEGYVKIQLDSSYCPEMKMTCPGGRGKPNFACSEHKMYCPYNAEDMKERIG